MSKDEFSHGPDALASFGMALAQNPNAMDVFSGLNEEQRRKVLDKSRRIRSKSEMRSYVDSLVGMDPMDI